MGNFYFLKPTRIFVFLIYFAVNAISAREIHIAVNSDNKIPTPSINPNHLISDTPTKKRINADKNEVI